LDFVQTWYGCCPWWVVVASELGIVRGGSEKGGIKKNIKIWTWLRPENSFETTLRILFKLGMIIVHGW
jgi:hypothetical protein